MKGNLIKGAHKKSGLGKNKPASQKTDTKESRRIRIDTSKPQRPKGRLGSLGTTGGHSLGKFSQVIFSTSLKTVGVILIIIVIELYVLSYFGV